MAKLTTASFSYTWLTNDPAFGLTTHESSGFASEDDARDSADDFVSAQAAKGFGTTFRLNPPHEISISPPGPDWGDSA